MVFSNKNAVFWNIRPSSLMDMFRRYMLPVFRIEQWQYHTKILEYVVRFSPK
jgi:hypothetical protein